MEKRNLEQHCAIKFCVKLNKNTTETYKKLKRAYGEQLYRGYRFLGGIKRFWMAKRAWKDEPLSGRPCTSKTDENVTKVRALVGSDHRFTE